MSTLAGSQALPRGWQATWPRKQYRSRQRHRRRGTSPAQSIPVIDSTILQKGRGCDREARRNSQFAHNGPFPVIVGSWSMCTCENNSIQSGPNCQLSASAGHDRKSNSACHLCPYDPARLEGAAPLPRQVTVQQAPDPPKAGKDLKLETAGSFGMPWPPGPGCSVGRWQLKPHLIVEKLGTVAAVAENEKG